MKTNVIGYPRIGEQRELKKAIESYFKSDISKEDLLEIGKSLRIKHWREQKNANINYISSNDFSFYDTSLDNIVLFNAIPKEYKILDGLDKYFAFQIAKASEKQIYKTTIANLIVKLLLNLRLQNENSRLSK